MFSCTCKLSYSGLSGFPTRCRSSRIRFFSFSNAEFPCSSTYFSLFLGNAHHFHDLVVFPRVAELLSKLRRFFEDSFSRRLVVLRPIVSPLFPHRIHKAMRQFVQRLRASISLVHSRHSVDVCVQMAIQIRRHAFAVDRFQLLAVEFVPFRGVEAVFQNAFDAQTVAVTHAFLTVVAREHDAVIGLRSKSSAKST